MLIVVSHVQGRERIALKENRKAIKAIGGLYKTKGIIKRIKKTF